LLSWLAARLPAAVMPDHLTCLGVLGSLICGLGFVVSVFSPLFLWLAIFGLAVNWFGDSLDGNLARHRGTERPRYGFFIDHTTDVVSQIFIFFGLGASPYTRLDIALLALLSYWLAALFTFIRAVATGVFQISYFGIGPTEIRIGLIAAAVSMMAGPIEFKAGGRTISLFNVIIMSIFIGVFISFLIMMWNEARHLAVLDADRKPPAAGPDVTAQAIQDHRD
jgi:phosphatidylglycerophosphate synthase